MKNIFYIVLVFIFTSCGSAQRNSDSVDKNSDNYFMSKSKQTINPTLNKKGKSLFKKCAGCHGQDADKRALNRSLVISKMSGDDIYNAILEYQAGERVNNHGMQEVMKGQVAKLSDDEIIALAEYISSLD